MDINVDFGWILGRFWLEFYHWLGNFYFVKPVLGHRFLGAIKFSWERFGGAMLKYFFSISLLYEYFSHISLI